MFFCGNLLFFCASQSFAGLLFCSPFCDKGSMVECSASSAIGVQVFARDALIHAAHADAKPPTGIVLLKDLKNG